MIALLVVKYLVSKDGLGPEPRGSERHMMCIICTAVHAVSAQICADLMKMLSAATIKVTKVTGVCGTRSQSATEFAMGVARRLQIEAGLTYYVTSGPRD